MGALESLAVLLSPNFVEKCLVITVIEVEKRAIVRLYDPFWVEMHLRPLLIAELHHQYIAFHQRHNIDVLQQQLDQVVFEQIRVHEIILVLYNESQDLVQPRELVVEERNVYRGLEILNVLELMVLQALSVVVELVEHRVIQIEEPLVFVVQQGLDAPGVKGQDAHHIGAVQL